MAFQRIRIKNSSVAGKIPDASALDAAELAINLKDHKLYSKDVDGNVFELGGKVDSGTTPPPGPDGNNIGDLFWDGDFLLVWNGNEWVPVGAADLDYTPAADKGTITNTAGDDVELPLADNTNAGLMSPDEHKKLDGMPTIISGNQFPGTPELGDIWIDTNLCPPSISIWNDCEDPGNPEWIPIGGGDPTGCQQGGVAIAGNSEIGSTLTATGGRGLDAGELLPDPTYTWTGPNGFTATGAEIVATEEGNYTVTATVTCIDGTTLDTSATKTISDSYVEMVNNTPPVIAVVGELPDGAYAGNSLYVVTPATVTNGQSPVIVENQWFRNGVAVGTSQLYVISAADPEGSVLTCKQLFRDARTNELLSEASNGIAIVARPADAITFNAVITDDGTDQGNTVGHVLTASALNIIGGTAPIEYAFEWLVGGLNMGTNKTLNLVQSFVGKVVVCNITVAEPDGSNPETRSATYDKIIEVAGTINTPTVLAPLNGDDYSQIQTRNLISDSITNVEGGGVETCETKPIENVDDTTDAPNVILTFPDETGFDCFEPGDVVQGAEVEAGDTYDSAYSSDDTASYQDATFLETVEIGTRPTVNVGTRNILYDFGKPVSNIEWVRYAGVLNNASNEFTLSISDDGINWTEVISGNNINSPTEQPHPRFISTTPARYYKIFRPGTINSDKYGFSDEVFNEQIHIIGKTDEEPWQITVDGGRWLGSDGSGTIDGDTELVKEIAYDTKLTVSGDKDLDDMVAGTSMVMSDGTPAGGPYEPTKPYKLVTTDIESVATGGRNYEDITIEATSARKFMFDSPIMLSSIECNSNGSGTYGRVFSVSNNGNKINFSNVESVAQITGDPYSANLTWAETFDDTSVGNRGGQNALNKTYKIVFNTPFEIDEIVIMNTDAHNASNVLINDELLDSDEYKTLTFPGAVSTNPDLQYFRQGDAVGYQTALKPLKAYISYATPHEGVIELNQPTINANGNELSTRRRVPEESFATMTKVGGQNVSPGSRPTGTESQPFLLADLGQPVANIKVVRYDGPTSNNNQSFALYGAVKAEDEWTFLKAIYRISDDENLPNELLDSGSTPYRYFAIGYSGNNIVQSKYGILEGIEVEYTEPVEVVGNGYDLDPKENKLVVDGGSWAQGDVVEYQTNGGKGKFVIANTDDNTIMLSDDPTATRDNRWIAENKAGTDFYVAGGQKRDEETLTADIRLQCSEFATTPENADTLNNIIWEINGTEESAGTVNPYKPSNLQTNTTYTVRAKHQGNSLDDSEFSNPVTFTTGATRNIREYYQQKIDLLETRLAGIEADEIVDDATDVTLLTAFANLVERVEALEGGA